MLWMMIGVMFVLWLIGTITQLGGAIIHILLLAAAVLVVAQLLVPKFQGKDYEEGV